jgi:hypothetical protein
MSHPNLEPVRKAAEGRWAEILSTIGGIPHEILDGKNHPCPKCGGKDRFRANAIERGAIRCNQCFATKNGDGFSALQWARGVGFKEALNLIKQHLGMSTNGTHDGPATTTTTQWKCDTLAAEYVYTDEIGQPAYAVRRYECPEWDGLGKKPKDFRQFRAEGDSFVGGKGCMQGVRLVPFKLFELLQRPKDPVFVVEGEKDVLALERLGLLATTNPGGAGKWPSLDPDAVMAVFKGRTVVLIPDNDQVGAQHMATVGKALGCLAKEIRLLTLPKLPPGGDVSDWLAAGGSGEALLELAVAAKPLLATTGPYPVHTFGDPATDTDFPVPEALIDGILFPGLTLIHGTWKRARKTLCAVDMAYCLESGLPFLGRTVKKTRCLWVQRDMSAGKFMEYTRELRAGLGLPPIRIPLVVERMDIRKPADQERLLDTLKEYKPELLFLDSSRALTGNMDENESAEVAELTRTFLIDKVRDGLKIHVVLIGHPSKGGKTARGSGEWEAAADSIMHFAPHFPEGAEHPDYTLVTGFGRHEDFTFAFTLDFPGERGGEGWALREVAPEDVADAARVVKERTKDQSDQGAVEALRNLPEGQGWLTISALRSTLNRGQHAMRRALIALVGRGVLETNGRVGKSLRYRFTSQGTPPSTTDPPPIESLGGPSDSKRPGSPQSPSSESLDNRSGRDSPPPSDSSDSPERPGTQSLQSPEAIEEIRAIEEIPPKWIPNPNQGIDDEPW